VVLRGSLCKFFLFFAPLCNFFRTISVIFILFFLFSLKSISQPSLFHDTIKINEVIISRGKSVTKLPGFKKTEIDSTILTNYTSKSLADILSENTGVFIKSYGNGGVASLSFRGTGANQTLIDWNGIKINNPMLGQSDLSTIPGGLIDNIQIYYGGASAQQNNGGFGGIINLETKPVWKKETMISIDGGAGSFGDYSGLIKVRTGSSIFQTVTKAFYHSAENNFPYTRENIRLTRTNDQFNQKGFVQELYYKIKDNVLSARMWYETSDRNIPPTSRENQFDESLRVMIKDDISSGRTDYSITVAGLFDRLNYQNVGVDSRNLSQSAVVKATSITRLGDFSRINITLNNDLTKVVSNNYDHIPVHNVATLSASLERSCTERFGTTLLLRGILDDNKVLKPDFSGGVQYRILENHNYFIKANISKSSRTPTMNDLYWPVGGNPDLKNEYAWILEITGDMSQQLSPDFLLQSTASYFRNSIRDMIQWDPGQDQIWSVYNLGHVVSSGIEASVRLNYSDGKLVARFNGDYTFTRSIMKASPLTSESSEGKQLIYIPRNQVNGVIKIGYGNVYGSWGATFCDKRFTSTDNYYFLPYYVINNASAGYRLSFDKYLADINLNVYNMFGYDYESVANYPMPGRSFILKILLQFTK
jgi:iron complex outermembrane receptor protein